MRYVRPPTLSISLLLPICLFVYLALICKATDVENTTLYTNAHLRFVSAKRYGVNQTCCLNVSLISFKQSCSCYLACAVSADRPSALSPAFL